MFGDAFGSLGSLTLEQALGQNGGGINALLRHAVAAVLNALHPGVDYPLTVSEIITLVNAAILGVAVIVILKLNFIRWQVHRLPACVR